MIDARDAAAIVRSRMALCSGIRLPERRTLEGGCGVIGIIGSDPLQGRLIIRSYQQMRNRGNGKGGGVAAVGLFGELRRHYALHVAYLDEQVKGEVERAFVQPLLTVDHAEQQPHLDDHREAGLEVKPPMVWRYFVRPRAESVGAFQKEHGLADRAAAEDELVYHNSFRLNQEHYAGRERPRAFVLSHGRDLMILKGVGYAEEIARYYQLEQQTAQIWIGHQRYPTRGRVWHPGGAHPFAGLHEALVHNGDFANYHAVTEYLRQRGLVPLFVTDTEVSVLLFDHYVRVLGYPLEFVIEALAPTPEGDFERLSKRRQRIYRAIQTAHLHGSPDGPWFFIVARAEPGSGDPQLIGITDVSMLRPQVFALQEGPPGLGAIASEKQAIDAFFEEVAASNPGVPTVADRYWNARGGSCTDGGAFVYSLRTRDGERVLEVRDKFGALIRAAAAECRRPEVHSTPLVQGEVDRPEQGEAGRPEALEVCLQRGDREGLTRLARAAEKDGRWMPMLEDLTRLRDGHWDARGQRRSVVLDLLDRAIVQLLDALPGPAGSGNGMDLRLTWADAEAQRVPDCPGSGAVLVVDARGFPPEGPQGVSRLIVAAHRRGWSRLVVYGCRGDRFIGCGLGPGRAGTRIDVYGSSGDYLGSGMDGAEIYVHGDAQDQVGQILNSGRIVVFGEVGQTLLYGAKGGEVFVLGSAAGRPLVNAVGQIRAVINGTCLDYCAESFMAGSQLGGGFVIINGLGFDGRGEVIGLEQKYPGNNLFSLASGGACYINDPYRTVSETQLNGAEFTTFRQTDWSVINPYLRINEELFGISIRHDLLRVDGLLKWPKEVFRKVVASQHTRQLDWSSLPA